MNNEPTELSVMEKVVIQGDLSALSPQERFLYYTKVCESVGLNPLTKPFDYLRLDGKLVLYAKRDCTDQLRKLQNISITITGRERIADVYCVTARGATPDGRTDEAMGVVSLLKEEKIWDEFRGKKVPTGNIVPLTPDELANALMKAETKAKRRVTLSLAGLGMMDESEIETVDGAERIIVQDEQAKLSSKSDEKSITRTAKKEDSPTSKNTKQSPKSNVYEFIDMTAGETPKGTAFLQMKVRNVDTSQEEIIFANTPETMGSLESIKKDSKFELECETENGIAVLKTIHFLQETRTSAADSERYHLIAYKAGKAPNGTPFAQLKVKNQATGADEVILARMPELIEATGKMAEGTEFSAEYSIENGFKLLKSIQIFGEAA